MNVDELPTTIVTATFALVKRPILVIGERFGAPDEWPPRIGLDRIESSVKTAMGSVLHDEYMVESGRELRARADRLCVAARTDAAAAAVLDTADKQYEERRERADARQERAGANAQARRRDIAAVGAARKGDLQSAAGRGRQQAERLADLAEAEIARDSRAKQIESLGAEADALEMRTAAFAERERAQCIDGAIERSQSKRKTR